MRKTRCWMRAYSTGELQSFCGSTAKSFQELQWKTYMQGGELWARNRSATQWTESFGAEHMKRRKKNFWHTDKKFKKCGRETHFAVKCKAHSEQKRRTA